MSKNENTIVVKDLRTMLQHFNERLGVYINDDQRWRLGKVLTVIDATIADVEQRKAIKDLIQNDWWGPGDRNSRIDGMVNPHNDLRAICGVLGFELYDKSTLAMPTAAAMNTSEFDQKHYRDVLKTRNQ